MKMLLALSMLCATLLADIPNQHWTFQVAKKVPERATGFLGFKPGWEKKANWQKERHMGVKLPDSWDWRTQAKKGLTPVQDQGRCGSCWVFASVGAFQDKIAIEEEKALHLSEQEALSCSRAGSCGGGYFDVMDFFVTPGMALASDFPYAARNLRCKRGLKAAANLASWTFIGTPGTPPSVDDIKTAIYTHGPVVVTVTANYALMAYKSGVFNGCTSGATNHMVVLEGWGMNGLTPYWIMRNSWGPGFGEGGYVRFTQGCSRIGEVAAYLTLP